MCQGARLLRFRFNEELAGAVRPEALREGFSAAVQRRCDRRSYFFISRWRVVR